MDSYNRRVWLGQAGALLAGIGGCTSKPRPSASTDTARHTGSAHRPTTAAPQLSAAPAVATVDPAWQAALINDRNFAQPVLFTWTTAAQIAELRRTKRLLVHRRSKSGQLSRFDTELETRTTDAMAGLLRTGPLSLRRFAWSQAWATLRGWPGETYGSHLIRVRLKPDALVARFEAGSDQPWRISTLTGRPVQVEEVQADPSRLAAIYHVAKRSESTDGVSTFREYVLCSESQIAEWSYGTLAIKQRLEREEALVRSLASHAPPDALRLSTPPPVWSSTPPKLPRDYYHGAIAFLNDNYRFTQASLKATADEVAAIVSGAPLVIEPKVAFAAQARPAPTVKPRPKKPPKSWKKKRCWGTFC